MCICVSSNETGRAMGCAQSWYSTSGSGRRAVAGAEALAAWLRAFASDSSGLLPSATRRMASSVTSEVAPAGAAGTAGEAEPPCCARAGVATAPQHTTMPMNVDERDDEYARRHVGASFWKPLMKDVPFPHASGHAAWA